MKIPFYDFNKICLSILFLFIGSTTSAQNFYTLKSEYDFKIRLEVDSILLIKKSQRFKASAFITSQNKICLNSDVMDSEHHIDSGICYELEALQNDSFVPYRELEDGYAMDVNSSGDLYSELSKKLSYDFNPFNFHSPTSNRIYRFRVFFRLGDQIVNTSEWKYVYAVWKKNQIKEFENWRQLVKANQLKKQDLKSLSLESYLKQAKLCLKQKRFEMSREYSLKALEIDSLCAEAYFMIGYAYAGFSNSLKKDFFNKGFIYCLAVDQFKKAMELDENATEKADLLIKVYSKYFHSQEYIYIDLKEGDKYKIGFWINEETTVRYLKY
ncbi:tetratricopeptide repeat protein [Labilibaculum euxinus]|uniref:Tetratricopeptide repeat protein n=1 Tax=Labilibaculum euxinus TaxID=2686357 RepID=A0A7M4D2T0_9BACT|nr:hypothetical protein [Labilibaculum euxinus]MUP36959.1 hypothetical protein [Labilibaculum euxinus]MVB06164.1 hypothetical protein [Labilibaculum euxinus]